MKRQVMTALMLAAVMVAAVNCAWGRGCDPVRHEEGRSSEGKKEGEHRLVRMAKQLGLSDDQRAKIENIIKGEREKSAPLVQKLQENRKQLRQMEQTPNFDEPAVRKIAESQAQLLTELMVEKARSHNRIMSLLTPEQRVLAEKIEPSRGDRGPGHRPPMHERNHGPMPLG